jgi:hypothetical protein
MVDEFDHHQAEIAARLAEIERRLEQLTRIVVEENSRSSGQTTPDRDAKDAPNDDSGD